MASTHRPSASPPAPEPDAGPAAAQRLQEAAHRRLAEGDVAGAVHHLQNAITSLYPVAGADEPATEGSRPLRAGLELELGRLFEEELGRLDGALLHYQHAFKLRPEDPTPLRRGRAIYRQLGDVAMVSRLFELELAGPQGEDPPLLLEFARHKLDKERDPAGAAALLLPVLHQHDQAQLPPALLETLADAFVSPDYAPAQEGDLDREHALRQAGELYLALGTRLLAGRAPGDEAGDARDYLRRALGASPGNAAAASALEQLYQELPSPEREDELLRLYRTGARVPRRALKLLALWESRGPLQPAQQKEAIAACRAGLDEADNLDDWHDTRAALRRLLQEAGDAEGLAALLREDAAEAALPEERAELLLQAADLHRKAGDPAGYLARLEEAFREDPAAEPSPAFRRLCEYHTGRRDLQALAAIHEERLGAQVEAGTVDAAAYAARVEELADLYEKKLQDLAAAADAWRRADEALPTPRSQRERQRLGQRLTRVQLQIAELQLELDRTPPEAVGRRADLLRRLAQQHREQHDAERAAGLYEELLLFLPSDVQALKALYELRELRGDVPGQIQVLRQQVAVAQGRAERLSLLRRIIALSAELPHDTPPALAAQAEVTAWTCVRLLAELPSDRDALRRLAEAQERLGDRRGLRDTIEAQLRVAATPADKLPLHRAAARLYEETGESQAAIAHLERAARLCPPGPELEAVLLEVAAAHGQAGRRREEVLTLELAAKNARASEQAFRLLARACVLAQGGPPDPALPDLQERCLRALGEVLRRVPNDLEALEELARLRRARGEWRELERVLRRWLEVPDQPLPRRLQVALQLADVLALRLDDRPAAVAVLEDLQRRTPVCDRQLHRRLRLLYEDLGQPQEAARCAERELLLTEDPLARMEVAMAIAGLWRHRAQDPGRALLSFERILELLPDTGHGGAEPDEARRLAAQALDAISEIHAEAQAWQQVAELGERRVALASGEPMRAACILAEVAAVHEEKLDDPRRGFALRRRAFEIAPEMTPVAQMEERAAAAGLWEDLCSLHLWRYQHGAGTAAQVLESLLAAARIYEERLGDRSAAWRLLREALPPGAAGAEQAATPGSGAAAVLGELERLCRGDAAQGRELVTLLQGMVDELCGRRGAGTEEVAVRVHRLLGRAARVREAVLGDPRGALDDRLRAFAIWGDSAVAPSPSPGTAGRASPGGERDRGSHPAADPVFAETVAEVRRLALSAGQLKEALAMDARRLERAEGEVLRSQVAADAAAWLDDEAGDATKALRAALRALPLCLEGSDVQAEVRGRLLSLGRRLGAMAWEEITRAERGLPVPEGDGAAQRRRLRYVAALWERGAGDILRAIEATGQAYRATFAGAPREESEEESAERAELRQEMERLCQRAPEGPEALGRVVALLDGIAAQLGEAGAAALQRGVLLDAGRTDERRGRFPHAERRFQEVLRGDPGNAEALAALQRLYRQLRRWNDLVALLERRRALTGPERVGGAERRALLVELGEVYQQTNKSFEALEVFSAMAAEDPGDPEPHARMARIHEGQRAYARAAEAHAAEAGRARGSDPARAVRALLRSGELWEKQAGPGRGPELQQALAAYIEGLGLCGEAMVNLLDEGGDEAAARALQQDIDQLMGGSERILGRLGRGGEAAALVAQRLGELRALPVPAERPDLPGLPVFTQARIALLWRQVEGGPGDEALSCAEELGALLPEDDRALATLGGLLAQAGRVAEARDLAQRRAEAAAKSDRPAAEQAARQAELARLELRAGNPAGAAAALERALGLDPHDVSSLRALAELRLQQGDRAGHVAALRALAAEERDPDAAAASLVQAAQAQAADLGLAAARPLLEEALARYPEGEALRGAGQEALALLGDLALTVGDEAEAAHYAGRELRGEVDGERAATLHTRLGQIALDHGDRAGAEEHFTAALSRHPGDLAATRALVALIDEDERAAALLEEALDRAAEAAPALPAAERAALLRQLGAARLRLAQAEAGYQALNLAEELAPGTLAERVALGEAAYRLGYHEVAAHHLDELRGVDGDAAGLPGPVLLEALVHGARAHLALGERPAARALAEEALRRAPGHAEAEAAYLEVLQHGAAAGEAADREAAVALLARLAQAQAEAGDLAGAVGRYQDAVRVLLAAPDEDAAIQAAVLLEEAAALARPGADPGLRERLTVARLELAQARGDRRAARQLAAELVELAASPAERAARLRQVAVMAAEAGDREGAAPPLRAALAAVPGDPATLLLISDLLPDRDVADLLGPALESTTATEASLIEVWARLGETRARTGDGPGAAAAFARAVAGAGSGAMALRRRAVAALEGVAGPEVLREHLQALLWADQEIDFQVLRRLQRLEEEAGHAAPARRLRQVLAVLEGADVAPEPAAQSLLKDAQLSEAEQAALAEPPARDLAEVMAALWEGVAGPRAPTPEQLGAGERVPPSESSPDAVARLVGLAGRVLGQRRGQLYRAAGLDGPWPQLCAHPPGALLCGPGVAALPPRQALFAVGRAVALLRPEYVLAEALPPRELARLFGLAVRAFHPRHARHGTEAVSAWRRELPYRAVKRISDLLREHADLPFSTAAWRRAVRRTAQRSALLLCGDLHAAASLLRQGLPAAGAPLPPDEIEADVRDLVRFWLSPAGAALADRLHPA